MTNELLTPLTPLGLLAVEGVDAAKFLQGQITCDVNSITEQQSRLGAHCDPKGRIQFNFHLFKHQDIYYLHLARNLMDHALKSLQKYAIFSKVKLMDVSEQWSSIGLGGTRCLELLAETCGLTLSNTPDAVVSNSDCVALFIEGIPPRVKILGKTDVIHDLWQTLSQAIQPTDFNAWHLLNIQNRMPNITPETIGVFTPHDIDYPQLNAVSFNKGCYTGQEIVARMHYLGKLKSHMVQVQFFTEGTPQPGTKCVMQQGEQKRDVGYLIDFALDSSNTYQALALLADAALTSPIFLAETNTPLKLFN